MLSEIFSGGVFKTHAKHQRLSFLPLFLQESSITVAWQCFNVSLFKKLFSEPLLTVHSVLAFSGKHECKLFSGKAWPLCSSRVYSCYKILRSKYFFQNYSNCHILSILKSTSKRRPRVYEMVPGNEFYHEWPGTSYLSKFANFRKISKLKIMIAESQDKTHFENKNVFQHNEILNVSFSAAFR